MTQMTSSKRLKSGTSNAPCSNKGSINFKEHIVIALTYEPLPDDSDLNHTVDCLTDVLDDLSPRQSGRAMVEFTGGERRYWLLLHISSAQPAAIPQGQDALQQQAVLLERLQATGLRCEVASSEACDALLRGFPQPHVEDRRVVDHQGRIVVTLTTREIGEVTQPGITRQLVDFLSSRGQLAYLVLDFRNDPQGWARFDLTLVLTATNELEGQQAAQAAEDMVFTNLGGLATREPPKRAMNALRRATPFSRAQPRLPASAGNIADLFPL